MSFVQESQKVALFDLCPQSNLNCLTEEKLTEMIGKQREGKLVSGEKNKRLWLAIKLR